MSNSGTAAGAEWTSVCNASDLVRDGGVCVLYNNTQVALFWEGVEDRLYAIANYDPIGEAYVLSRGILGSNGDATVVASPLYKQHFDLKTGQCLEQEDVSVEVFDIQLEDDTVQLRLPQSA